MFETAFIQEHGNARRLPAYAELLFARWRILVSQAEAPGA
jgi:hypothetical protein